MSELASPGGFDNALQIITLMMLGLPIFLFRTFMACVVYMTRIKLYLSQSSETRIDVYKEGRMFEITELSTEEQKDFKKHRSFCYVDQLTYGCLWEFSKFIGGKQRVPLIDNDTMLHCLLNTVFCNGLVKEDKHPNISYRLPFHIKEYKLFPGYYWDVKEIRIHKDKTLSIEDRFGKVHTPNSVKWSLAKAHAQAQLTFFAPGLAHNHVHFVFPTLMASLVRQVLPEDSILRKLVEPHTRFTQYINYKALNECQSSSNTGSFFDRWFRPWLSFPIDNDDFLTGIQQNCEEFYYEKLKLTQDLDEDLPYHKFLKEYYKVVESYVTKLVPLIEDDYVILKSEMKRFLPAISDYDVRDVITTLVWNCGMVHFSDHHSYLQLFANKYGCMAVRTSLGEKEKVENVKMSSEATHIAGEASNFFVDEDVYRTRCFLRTFVRYNKNPKMNLSLLTTKYGFTDRNAANASSEFIEDLRSLEKSLKKNNNNIIALPEIVRTLCF